LENSANEIVSKYIYSIAQKMNFQNHLAPSIFKHSCSLPSSRPHFWYRFVRGGNTLYKPLFFILSKSQDLLFVSLYSSSPVVRSPATVLSFLLRLVSLALLLCARISLLFMVFLREKRSLLKCCRRIG